MNNPPFAIVIVEDGRQRQLLYRFLLHSGVKSHQMRIEISPSGRGSGEQWVRAKYADHVKICRRRNASKGRTALLIMLDADLNTLRYRLNAFSKTLSDDGQQPIDERNEAIARLIPKRNVETWILSLNKVSVDESQDYKGTRNEPGWSKLIPGASRALYELYIQDEAQDVVLIDSLRHGVQELRRTFAGRS